MPPDFSSADAYFTWAVAAHNAVNSRPNTILRGQPALWFILVQFGDGSGRHSFPL